MPKVERVDEPDAEMKPLSDKEEKLLLKWEAALTKLKGPLESVTTMIAEDTDKTWSQFLPTYTVASATAVGAKMDAFAASLVLIKESKQVQGFASVAKEYKSVVEQVKEISRSSKLQVTEAQKHAAA